MSVVGDLRRARDILRKGWCSKGLQDEAGNVCAMGALNIACYGVANPSRALLREGDDRRWPAYALLREHLPEGPWDDEIAFYNDHASTTHRDILNLFDKTLADLGGL